MAHNPWVLGNKKYQKGKRGGKRYPTPPILLISLVSHTAVQVLLCLTYHPYLVQGRAHDRHQETIMDIINQLLLYQGVSYLDRTRGERGDYEESTAWKRA